MMIENILNVSEFDCYMSGHGGGWGYSGHSIEAVRFMSDTDILLGGLGLFGGRGEYYGRIKVCGQKDINFGGIV
jgi:E3 ubiquitin-protein ligase MYCBP2